MAINLDADVGKIVKDFFNKKKSSGRIEKTDKVSSKQKEIYKQTGVKFVIILSVTLAICWGINFFTESSIEKDISEFATKDALEDAVVNIEQNIASSSLLLAKNKKKVEEYLPMFSDIGDSKNLFKVISNLASDNRVIIKNVTKGKKIIKSEPAEYAQTEIRLEVEAFYNNYLNFKKELKNNKEFLTINKEVVKLKTNSQGERKLDIALNLTDYAIKKNAYEKLLK